MKVVVDDDKATAAEVASFRVHNFFLDLICQH